MSHVLLEKTDHLSDTIYKYQKGKHVMATPSNLVLRSDLDFDAGKREVILDTWDRQVADRQVTVRTNADVTGIAGQAGAFTLTLQDGSTVEAEAVVLAIGTQGNPNLLRLPGGDLPHVQYQLDDPTEYVDEHITVIGSGDAGIENALGLAADAGRKSNDHCWHLGCVLPRVPARSCEQDASHHDGLMPKLAHEQLQIKTFLRPYLLRAIMTPKWLFLPAVFRPLRTAFRGLGAGFLNLGEKTEGTAKKRGKNEQKWARNGLRRVGVGGNHYCAE